MHLSVSAAAQYLGVCISTLRRWDTTGYLKPDYRTAGGHRRYSVHTLQSYSSGSFEIESTLQRKTVLYSRVSSFDQKADLERQSSRLEEHATKENYSNVVILKDLGSGVNYKKPGLKKLLKMLLDQEVERLVLHHKDRLLRFGSELVFSICRHLGVEIVILEESLGTSFEQELASDVIEIMTVFSSRLYGKRSHKNRKKAEAA